MLVENRAQNTGLGGAGPLNPILFWILFLFRIRRCIVFPLQNSQTAPGVAIAMNMESHQWEVRLTEPPCESQWQRILAPQGASARVTFPVLSALQGLGLGGLHRLPPAMSGISLPSWWHLHPSQPSTGLLQNHSRVWDLVLLAVSIPLL
jgi:hypothetical protein